MSANNISVGTSSLWGSSSTTSHTTLNTNGAYSFPNSSGVISASNSVPWTISSDSYYNPFDFEEKVLDLEKISNLDTVKRELIMELFASFTKCEDYNTKKLIHNTLEVYNVITTQKALERKMKISKITNNE